MRASYREWFTGMVEKFYMWHYILIGKLIVKIFSSLKHWWHYVLKNCAGGLFNYILHQFSTFGIYFHNITYWLSEQYKHINGQLTRCFSHTYARVYDKLYRHQCILFCMTSSKLVPQHNNPFCILDKIDLLQEDIWPSTPVLGCNYRNRPCIVGSTEARLWLDNHW